MDLSIPGEKNMYLRAPSSQERQQWLVALGSSKACLTNNNRKDSVADPMLPDTIKSKKSELRLYCDLLMQQVHMVKTSVTSEEGPDLEKLKEGSSLLSATCDTFIKTLEDCLQLSNKYLEPIPSGSNSRDGVLVKSSKPSYSTQSSTSSTS